MNSKEWVETEKQKAQSFKRLYNHILGNFYPYFFYRIRYSLLRFSTSYVLFLIEFFILLQTVYASFAIPFLFARIAISGIITFTWGSIEGLREKLRKKSISLANSYIQRVIFSYRLIAIPLLIIGFFLLYYDVKNVIGVLAFYHIYILYFLLLVFIELDYSIHQTSIFVHKRVHKKVWPYIVIDIFGTMSLFIGYTIVGPYALPVSLIIHLLLKYIVHMYYIKKNMSELYGNIASKKNLIIFPFSSLSVGLLHVSVFSLPFMYLFSSGFANLSNTYIIVSLIATPLLSFSFFWSKLFYFDIKKMQKDWFLLGIKELYKKLLVYAIFIGLILLGINTVIQFLYFGRIVLFLEFSFLFICSSLLGVLILRLTTTQNIFQRYGLIILSIFSIVFFAEWIPYILFLFFILFFLPKKEYKYSQGLVPLSYFAKKPSFVYQTSNPTKVKELFVKESIPFAKFGKKTFVSRELPFSFFRGYLKNSRRLLSKDFVQKGLFFQKISKKYILVKSFEKDILYQVLLKYKRSNNLTIQKNQYYVKCSKGFIENIYVKK